MAVTQTVHIVMFVAVPFVDVAAFSEGTPAKNEVDERLQNRDGGGDSHDAAFDSAKEASC